MPGEQHDETFFCYHCRGQYDVNEARDLMGDEWCPHCADTHNYSPERCGCEVCITDAKLHAHYMRTGRSL